MVLQFLFLLRDSENDLYSNTTVIQFCFQQRAEKDWLFSFNSQAQQKVVTLSLAGDIIITILAEQTERSFNPFARGVSQPQGKKTWHFLVSCKQK